MEESLKERTAKGLFWGAMNSGSTQVLNLVIGIVLARLLSPADYGIVGVLTIFTIIAGELQNAGFTQAILNIPHPTSRDYNSVFSFNVIMSAIMYSVLFVSAPLIGSFFHQPCLIDVSRLVFLSFFIGSFGIAHNTYMIKNMMNKEIAVIGIISLICSGTIGITLADLGFSYWALAWQQITYITIFNIGRYYCVREWRPHFTFDNEPIKRMVPFAIKILATRVLSTLSNNILTVIFGRLFPIHQVGNYSQAYKWDTMTSSLISNTIGQLAQTVLVEANAEDGEGRELRVYRKMMRFTAFLSMPLMFGLAIVAKEFIIITIGEKWLGCAPLLQVLCISGAFMPFYIMYQNLSLSQTRSDLYMLLNVIQIIMQILVIFAVASYGMFVMTAVYSAFIIIWLIPWHFHVGRLIDYRWHDAFKDVAPFTFIAILTMGITYGVTMSIESVYVLLPLRILIASLLYYAALHLTGAKIIRECEGFAKKIVRR